MPKGGDGDVPPDPDQSKWIEGDARRETHIRYERDQNAVRKKKQAFRDKHEGRLGCEKCGCFPVEYYGKESGEACIEVHHKVPLSVLGHGRQRWTTSCAYAPTAIGCCTTNCEPNLRRE